MTLREQIVAKIAEILWEDDERAGECADGVLQVVRAHDREKIEAQDAVIEAARDLVLLWQAQRISGATRAQRNAAIESVRQELISAIAALDAVLKAMEEK